MARTPKPSAHPEPTAPKRGRKKTRAGSSGSSSKDAAAGTEPSVEALPALSAAPARKPRIRPTYSPAIAEEICRRLAEGESLSSICRDSGMPLRSTVHWWVVDDHDGFSARYVRARDAGYDRMAEDLIEIGDACMPDSDHVARAKLRTDARKWVLAKMRPHQFGDRLQVDATVSVEAMDTRELVSTLQELATRLGVVLPDWITAIAKQEGTGE